MTLPPKKLIIVNGPMGVGKTTVCKCLKQRLRPCFFLDGDWCWEMAPFTVSDKNKKMVLKNIIFLLNSFLENQFCRSVLFCWVLPDEKIIEEIINGLKKNDFSVVKISLICSPDSLRARLTQRGNEETETIRKSLSYLPLYQEMNTIKFNTDFLTIEETAEKIQKIIMNT